MEPGPSGHIEIEVGMMHAVQAPQRRHGMEHDVLQIDGKIQRDDRDDYGKRKRYVEVIV